MKDIIRVLKKYRMIMSRGQKLRIGLIILMMLIGGVLETLSVSLIWVAYRMKSISVI